MLLEFLADAGKGAAIVFSVVLIFLSVGSIVDPREPNLGARVVSGFLALVVACFCLGLFWFIGQWTNMLFKR